MSTTAAPETPGTRTTRRAPGKLGPFRTLSGFPHAGLIAVLVVVIVFMRRGDRLVRHVRQPGQRPQAGQCRRRHRRGPHAADDRRMAWTSRWAATPRSPPPSPRSSWPHGRSTTFTVVVSLLLATAIGLVNGLVVTYTDVAPFVATLATATLLDGVALLVLDGLSVSIGEHLSTLGTEKTLGLPNLLIVAVLVLAVVGLIMKFTIFGRDAFAIGGNEHVARLSGINVNWQKLVLYGLVGALSGLAGLMLLSRLGASSPGTGGLQLQLTAVASVVIGGTMLMRRLRHDHRHLPRSGAARRRRQRAEPPPGLQLLPADLRGRRAARRGRRQPAPQEVLTPLTARPPARTFRKALP